MLAKRYLASHGMAVFIVNDRIWPNADSQREPELDETLDGKHTERRTAWRRDANDPTDASLGHFRCTFPSWMRWARDSSHSRDDGP
jgi:hypothetical protein